MLKLPSKFSVCRLGLIFALALFAQSSFGADEKLPTPLPPEPDAEVVPVKPKKTVKHEELPAPEETTSRYQDRYPKFSTVQTSFVHWSQQDNEGIIGQISADKWKKMAKWMSKIIDYRGVLDTDACSSKDAASSELKSALTFCFGVFDGESPAAVYRLVQALKAEEVDANEIRGAIKEITLCRTALKKMADGKRRKLGDRKGRSPMDWELDLDNIQPLLSTLEGIQVPEASASPSPSPVPVASVRTRAEECIIYHRDCYQQRLDETPLDKMCLLGDKPAEVVSARPTTPTESNVVPPPQPVPQQPTPNQPVPQPVPNQVPQPQPAPVAQPVPNYPAMPLPVAKNYGAGPCTGCGGGYRRGGAVGGGGGVVAGGGGVVPVARGGVAVGVGVGTGPVVPPPFPPPYPPRPIAPLPMPIIMGGGVGVGGPVGMPSVGGATVVASKTTVSISSGSPMPMMNMCMKGCPKGMPMGMMGGMWPMMGNPLMRPYPPRPGVNPMMRPPMVTPYYPGMPNTGGYGPIATTSPYQTPSVSPYVNPTFYTQTQPQTQYGPVAPYRGSVGRI